MAQNLEISNSDDAKTGTIARPKAKIHIYAISKAVLTGRNSKVQKFFATRFKPRV